MVKQKKSFNPEIEYENIKKNILDKKKINIDVANRVLLFIIENNNKHEIDNLFEHIKTYNNETTYSLIIRYYSKIDIEQTYKLIEDMINKKIRIKKRTVLPIFNKLCESKELKRAIYFFRSYIKKKYKLIETDYECFINLIFDFYKRKYLKTVLKSMKRNIKDINIETATIIEEGCAKNKINYQYCLVENGICNNVKLKSVDLKEKEKNTILNNIENNYAKDKKVDLFKYKKFLNENKKINILLDGANIMFTIDRKTTINSYHRLNTIYQSIKDLNMHPLVILHQRHFDYLEKSGLTKEEIKEANGIYKTWKDNGDLYLTPYKMNDDWFFLYGSVYKEKCLVVTNDHLRDHIFKISEKEIHEDILKKWIERRVIRYKFKYEDYKNKKTLTLTFPLKYSERIQKIKTNWYLPIRKHKKWLVIYLSM